MADISDYNHEPTIDPRRLRLRPNRPALEPHAPQPVPEPVTEQIADPYGVGVDALVAVDEPAAPAVAASTHSSLFDEAASPALSQPARWGWRGRVNAALGTKLAPTPGSAETGY